MEDADIIGAVNDLLSTRTKTTAAALAERIGVDVETIQPHLERLEHQGQLLQLVEWWEEGPVEPGGYWVTPGATARYLGAKGYDAYEDRIRELAGAKGYTLVGSPGVPPAQRRYTLAVASGTTEDATLMGRGDQIEKTAWRLGKLPRAADLE